MGEGSHRPILRVSFIGTGNVATRMAERLREVGAEIVQMCSRGGTPVSELDPSRADMIIIAVSDDAIVPVLDSIPSGGEALWVHTAGSVGMEVFDSAKFPRHGILYPLQTMLKSLPVDWARVPLLVEGDEEVERVARLMSPSVARLDSASRRRLHAAAVMGCNMVMYLWSQSQEICRQAGLPFEMLHPLLQMTLDRATDLGPCNAMTGPARRGDLRTIAAHIAALPPEIADTYRELSRKMLAKFHPEITL